MPKDVRKRRHRRVGIVMEELYPNSVRTLSPELARHFDEGGDAIRAVGYYREAARRALESYAEEEALSSLCRALELVADTGLAFDLLEMRQDIYGRRGLRDLQLGDIDRLDRIAQASGDVDKIGGCLRTRIEFARATDDVGALARHLDDLDGLAERTGSHYWKALVLEGRAKQHVSTGSYVEGVRLAHRALPLFERTEDAPGLVRTLCLIADACTLQERAAQASEAIAQAIVHAQASQNEPLVVRTLSAASLAAYVNTDYVRAQDLAQQGLDICRTIGDREGEADFLLRLGNIESRRFAVEESIAMYSSALTIYEALGRRQGEAAILVNKGLLLIKVGQNDDALDAFRRARVIFVQSDDLRGLTICTINVGMVAFLQRRFGSARRLSQRAVEMSTRLGMPHLRCVSLGNLGASERELLDIDNAIAHSEEALRLRRRIAPADIASDLADMGLTYLRAGRLRESTRLADEISRIEASALNSVIFPQNVLWIAAQIYDESQKPDRYLDLLARAARSRDERLDCVPDGAWRDRYRSLPFNGEIQAALEAL
jgi:tetratricopeptide (TPR) repeat protein